MRRLPPRIVLPLAAALACTMIVLGGLWWQLAATTADLLNSKPRDTAPTTPTVTTALLPIDAGDESLLHLRKGDLLALKAEWKLAGEEYGQSVAAGGGLTALRKLVTAQLQIRDTAAARNTLEQMRRAGARAEDLLLIESTILLRTGDTTKAQELLTQSPPSPQQHYGLALLAIVQDNAEEARKQLAEVVGGWEPVLRASARILQSAYEEYALFPQSPQTHLDTLLARALAQVQECELALPLTSRVTSTEDDYRDAWIVQGFCELVTERTREALASFERAYALDPQKPEIQYFLGRSYAGMHDPGNASTFLQYAIENGFEPQIDARRLLIQQAVKANNAKLALEQAALLLTAADITLDTYEEYVSIAIALDRKEDAYLKATEASQKWPDNPEAWKLLGDTAKAADHQEEAKAAYERVGTIKP